MTEPSDEFATHPTPFPTAEPLVDEAVAATRNRTTDHDDLAALHAEVDQLKSSLQGTATGVWSATLSEVKARIQAKPVQSAAVIASLAFVYGLMR